MGKLFSDIVGHQKAITELTAQIASDNISHAYIFIGSVGSGKEFLAREFSKYTLCGTKSADSCPGCKNFDRGAHPDFIFIDGKTSVKIQDVREAIERVNLSPNLSNLKVLLIAAAENMNLESSNALLKTFEEPPLDTVIILTAASEDSVPQTILSRAQKIKIKPLSEKEIMEVLSKKYEKSKVSEVLQYTDGNIGEAIELLEDKNTLSARKKMFEDAAKIFKNPKPIDSFLILETYEKDKKMSEFFEVFSKIIFRSLSSDREHQDDFLKNYTMQEKVIIGKKILKIYADLKYNINLRLAVEALILETLQK